MPKHKLQRMIRSTEEKGKMKPDFNADGHLGATKRTNYLEENVRIKVIFLVTILFLQWP